MTTIARALATFCALIICSTAHATLQTDSQSQKSAAWEVVDISGRVLARRTASVRWLRLDRGTTLPPGTLIQVTPGAQISISASGGRVLHLREPTIVRIRPDLLREIKLDKMFLDALPERLVDADAAPRELPQWYFDEAWRRLAAIYTRTTAGIFGRGGSGDSGVGPVLSMSAGSLRVSAPRSGDVITLDRLPTKVDLRWTGGETNKNRWRIYRWAHGRDRGRPIAVTAESEYAVELPSPGDWYVQVTSVDESEVSAPVKIHAIASHEVVRALRPAPVHTIVATSDSSRGVSVAFSWECLARCQNSARSELLILRNGAGEHARVDISRRESVTISLPEGDYTWRFEFGSSHSPSTDQAESTPERKITVRPSTPDPLLLLTQLIESAGTERVSLELPAGL